MARRTSKRALEFLAAHALILYLVSEGPRVIEETFGGIAGLVHTINRDVERLELHDLDVARGRRPLD